LITRLDTARGQAFDRAALPEFGVQFPVAACGRSGDDADMRPVPARDEMERAFLGSDPSYDGVFVTAVRTTRVFCRPSCSARKPLLANVEFFASSGDALGAGYRACKRCRPLEAEGVLPGWAQPVLEYMSNPGIRLRDEDLRRLGLEPARVRRFFLKRFGMTFHAYGRSVRLGRALDQLRLGHSLDDVVFASGYESHSGFRDAFRGLVGDSPARARGIGRVVLASLETPLGPMVAGATPDGVCLLEFADRPMLKTQLRVVRQRLGAVLVPGESPHQISLARELAAYFSGTLRSFSVPLVAPGSPFQEKVWDQLSRIPFGATCTYEELARRTGAPGAQRAVGRANGDNRLAILIPCHRVVGSGGQLTGYGGGIWRKRLLLHLERTGEPLTAASTASEGSDRASPARARPVACSALRGSDPA
jgi:AraC family transcriptional regulator of adaptative response/methylated-DNA-[protein]-cysteine methyltransferase